MAIVLASQVHVLTEGVVASIKHVVDPEYCALVVDVDYGFWTHSYSFNIIDNCYLATVLEEIPSTELLKEQLVSATVDYMALMLFARESNLITLVQEFYESEQIDFRSQEFLTVVEQLQVSSHVISEEFHKALCAARSGL